MNIATILGLVAGVLTTASFLPQLIRTWKLKETKDISLTMYSMISVGIFLWLVYGIMIKELPIILANGVGFVFALIMLGFKMRYK